MKRQDVIYPILILLRCTVIIYVVLSTTLLEPLQSPATLFIAFYNASCLKSS